MLVFNKFNFSSCNKVACLASVVLKYSKHMSFFYCQRTQTLWLFWWTVGVSPWWARPAPSARRWTDRNYGIQHWTEEVQILLLGNAQFKVIADYQDIIGNNTLHKGVSVFDNSHIGWVQFQLIASVICSQVPFHIPKVIELQVLWVYLMQRSHVDLLSSCLILCRPMAMYLNHQWDWEF